MPTQAERSSWNSSDLLDVRSTMIGRCSGEITTSSFPNDEHRPRSSEEQNVFRLCMSLIMVIFGIYIVFRVLLILHMPHIIEASVARWEVKTVDFDIGPPSIWVRDQRADVWNIPRGAHVNISFSLSIANNPSWLVVDIFRTDIHVGRLGDLIPYPYSSPQLIDETLQFRQSVRWVDLNEAGYICLTYARNMKLTVILDMTIGATFSIFGHHSRGYQLTTSVTVRWQRRDGKRPIFGEESREGCLRYLAPRTTHSPGTITAVDEFQSDRDFGLTLNRLAILGL